ncbi:hypothetical protein HO875_10570 [Streptococcus suis]|nr:hypothetical protein [Streptococcus suis]
MFSKLFKKTEVVQPNFYESGSHIIGVFPLSESEGKLLFPKYPETQFQVDNRSIDEFRLLVMSEEEDKVLVDLPYKEGLTKPSPIVVNETDTEITISKIDKETLYQLF